VAPATRIGAKFLFELHMARVIGSRLPHAPKSGGVQGRELAVIRR